MRAGRHDIGIYLDLAGAFAADETPEVGSEMANRIATVRSDVAAPADRAAFDAWVRTRYRPALDAVGIGSGIGDHDDTNSRRGTLMQLLEREAERLHVLAMAQTAENMQARARDAEGAAQDLARVIQDIKTSWSWRVTSPLRSVLGALLRFSGRGA